MAIKPIKRENISEQVYEQLKHQLLIGEWKPGEKIPSENELSAAFGVSRVTVRHALQKLTVLGLIETRLGEGSFVKEVNPGVYMKAMVPLVYLGKDAVNEVMEFRSIIEVGTAEIAAKKMTYKEVRKLENNLIKMEENRNDLVKYVDYDLAFHSEIAAVTGNSLIIQMYDILKDILRVTIQNITEENGVDIGLKYHRLLLESMKNNDAQRAKDTMRAHVEEALASFNKNA